MASDEQRRGDRRSRLRRVLTVLVGVVAVIALLVAFVQPLRVRAEAGVTVLEALGLVAARPFASDVDAQTVRVGGVTGSLYDPGPAAPAVVLVPGATPEGRDDPRVVQVAEALARAGRAVFVPELEVYREDLVQRDVDRIVRAAVPLTGAGRGPVVLAGMSFGGSLCLLAAADPRLDGRVAQVATFGAYADLVGVVQAATTGVSLVDGRRIPWPADERAEDVVRTSLVSLLPPDRQQPILDVLDGRAAPAQLDPATQAVHDLLVHDDPTNTFRLAARLPGPVRDRLEAMSPASVAGELGVPVVAMHATDDPVIPYGELFRLGAAVPHAELRTVRSFRHVDFEVGAPTTWGRAARDLVQVWRFATVVLGAQDGRR